jgi:hypothetical protein
VVPVTAEVDEVVCPAASKLAAANKNKEATRMTQAIVFVMISAPERAEPGRPNSEVGWPNPRDYSLVTV